MESPTISVLVGGRFHADRMTHALLASGHDAELFTTFPKNRMKMIPPHRLHSFVWPEIRSRILARLNRENLGDILKIKSFGKSAAKALMKRSRPPQIIISWSSYGLETLRAFPNSIKIVVRDSAHIEEQMEIFEPEFKKWNAAFPNRTEIVNRELEEYRIADHILVCSDFIKDTFVKRGVSAGKIKKILLGAEVKVFKPKTEYRNQLPLHVVYFGSLSIYKGLVYLLEATKDISPERLKLTLVGSRTREFDPILNRYQHAEIIPSVQHPRLAEILSTQDVFVMPSLQDGYAMTVPQSMSAGLACVISDHTGAKELIQNGENGFIIPICDSGAIRNVLEKFLANPSLVEQIGRRAASQSRKYSWETYGESVSSWIDEISGTKKNYAAR